MFVLLNLFLGWFVGLSYSSVTAYAPTVAVPFQDSNTFPLKADYDDDFDESYYTYGNNHVYSEDQDDYYNFYADLEDDDSYQSVYKMDDLEEFSESNNVSIFFLPTFMDALYWFASYPFLHMSATVSDTPGADPYEQLEYLKNTAQFQKINIASTESTLLGATADATISGGNKDNSRDVLWDVIYNFYANNENMDEDGEYSESDYYQYDDFDGDDTYGNDWGVSDDDSVSWSSSSRDDISNNGEHSIYYFDHEFDAADIDTDSSVDAIDDDDDYYYDDGYTESFYNVYSDKHKEKKHVYHSLRHASLSSLPAAVIEEGTSVADNAAGDEQSYYYHYHTDDNDVSYAVYTAEDEGNSERIDEEDTEVNDDDDDDDDDDDKNSFLKNMQAVRDYYELLHTAPSEIDNNDDSDSEIDNIDKDHHYAEGYGYYDDRDDDSPRGYYYYDDNDNEDDDNNNNRYADNDYFPSVYMKGTRGYEYIQQYKQQQQQHYDDHLYAYVIHSGEISSSTNEDRDHFTSHAVTPQQSFMLQDEGAKPDTPAGTPAGAGAGTSTGTGAADDIPAASTASTAAAAREAWSWLTTWSVEQPLLILPGAGAGAQRVLDRHRHRHATTATASTIHMSVKPEIKTDTILQHGENSADSTSAVPSSDPEEQHQELEQAEASLVFHIIYLSFTCLLALMALTFFGCVLYAVVTSLKYLLHSNEEMRDGRGGSGEGQGQGQGQGYWRVREKSNEAWESEDSLYIPLVADS